MISVADWFESMREGTVWARSNLLLECYLRSPSRFPKHEKYETRMGLSRHLRNMKKEAEACCTAQETFHYFVFKGGQ